MSANAQEQEFLDKKINRFIIMCVEQYASSVNLGSNLTYNQLNEAGIIDELEDDYEDMHGMSTYSINEYIGKLVKDINNIASLDASISTSYQKNTLTKLSANLSRIDEYTTLLKDKYEETCKISDMEKQAFYIKDNLLPLMAKLRGFVDECEIMMPKETWPMPTYEELLFSEH